MAFVQPITAFNFQVAMWNNADTASGASVAFSAITSVASAIVFGGFQQVDGLTAELDVEDYVEGGRNRGPLKFAKGAKYPNLVFKRGVTMTPELWDWHAQVTYGKIGHLRKDGLIVLNERSGALELAGNQATQLNIPIADSIPVAAWYFRGGLPTKLQGPQLNAQDNQIAIETLEIAHQELRRVSLSNLGGGAADALGKAGL